MTKRYRPTYHGETMSTRELAERTGIFVGTLQRWLRTGTYDEARIDEILRIRELREVAVRNGVDLHATRIRRWRGWPVEASYTVPHNGRLKSAEGIGQ